MKYQTFAFLIVLIFNKRSSSTRSLEYEEYSNESNDDQITVETDCEEDTKWTMNCYTCSCDDGRASCSREKMCKVPPNTEPKLCKPYSKFYLDTSKCQVCECNADGLPICTFDYYHCKTLTGYQFYDTDRRRQSVIQARVPPGFRRPPICPYTVIELNIKKCEPNTQWFARCYWCTCNMDGQPRCDHQAHCLPPSSEVPARCRPGSHPFNIKCLNCYCNDDGYPQPNITKPIVGQQHQLPQPHVPHHLALNTGLVNGLFFNLN